MLFILTGAIQSGKTRWLLSLLDCVREHGVLPFGVVAPGVWRDYRASSVASDVGNLPESANASDCATNSSPSNVYVSGGFECAEMKEFANICAASHNFMPHGRVDENGLEKLGICNVLFPQERALLFAQRRDIAQVRGVIDATSQSERSQLGWYMDNSAIETVNRHFEQAVQRDILDYAQECEQVSMFVRKHKRRCEHSFGHFAQAFLIIDELGRMELMNNSGLNYAMQLLRSGQQKGCKHALVVVREQLLDLAHEQLGGAWGECVDIFPDESGRKRVLDAITDLNNK